MSKYLFCFLACGFSAGIWLELPLIIIPDMHDVGLYLRNAQYPELRFSEWAPLYSGFFKMLLLGWDPWELLIHHNSVVIVMFFLSVYFFFLKDHHSTHALVATMFVSTLGYYYVNSNVIQLFALFLILIGLLVVPKRQMGFYGKISIIMMILSYVRPEYYLFSLFFGLIGWKQATRTGRLLWVSTLFLLAILWGVPLGGGKLTETFIHQFPLVYQKIHPQGVNVLGRKEFWAVYFPDFQGMGKFILDYPGLYAEYVNHNVQHALSSFWRLLFFRVKIIDHQFENYFLFSLIFLFFFKGLRKNRAFGWCAFIFSLPPLISKIFLSGYFIKYMTIPFTMIFLWMLKALEIPANKYVKLALALICLGKPLHLFQLISADHPNLQVNSAKKQFLRQLLKLPKAPTLATTNCGHLDAIVSKIYPLTHFSPSEEGVIDQKFATIIFCDEVSAYWKKYFQQIGRYEKKSWSNRINGRYYELWTKKSSDALITSITDTFFFKNVPLFSR